MRCGTPVFTRLASLLSSVNKTVKKMTDAERARIFRAKMRELFIAGDPVGIEYVKKKAEQDRKYREKNKDKIAIGKKAALEDIYAKAEAGCEVSKTKVDKIRNSKTKWNTENPEYFKRYFQENKERYLGYGRKSSAKPSNKLRVLEYERERRKTDANFKISQTLRARLNSAIKNDYKRCSAVRDLGCSIEEFKIYIEAMFEPWMTWENFGVYKVGGERKWHLDHIKPLAAFDLTDQAQLEEAVHYTNYQPLCAIENIRKGAKIA